MGWWKKGSLTSSHSHWAQPLPGHTAPHLWHMGIPVVARRDYSTNGSRRGGGNQPLPSQTSSFLHTNYTAAAALSVVCLPCPPPSPHTTNPPPEGEITYARETGPRKSPQPRRNRMMTLLSLLEAHHASLRELRPIHLACLWLPRMPYIWTWMH